MATGDVTSTYEGTFKYDEAALLTELDTLNTGAATAGADTTSIIIVPASNGIDVHIYTIARAA